MEQLLKLVVVFFQIGLFSIGGGYAIIPLIQEQVVERFGWISSQTFTNIITISQMTPGPLAVNASTFVGMQIAGIPGAVFATAGCVVSGVVVSVLLYRFFQRHHRSAYISALLSGLKASSLGLIGSAAVTILLLALTGSGELSRSLPVDWIAAAVFVFSLTALRRWKLHPVLTMALAGGIGWFLYTAAHAVADSLPVW